MATSSIQALKRYPPTPERSRQLAELIICHQRALFRFNSLPDDIILQIFYQGTFCSPEDKNSSRMPLVYSHVCRRWRKLSCESSWLWSFITFRNDDLKPPPYPLIQFFLDISGLAPLIIDINISDPKFDAYGDSPKPPRTQLDSLMSMLLPHANRWRTFVCQTDNLAPLYDVIRKLGDKNLPLLQNLEFHQNFNIDSDDDEPLDPLHTLCPFTVGGATPVLPLNRLHLGGIPLNWRHLSNLHLTNLTEFTLSRLPYHRRQSPSLQEFLNIMTASPNLRKLSLINCAPSWGDELGGSGPPPSSVFRPIYLFNLEHFDFQVHECIDSSLFIFGLSYLADLMTMINFGPKLYILTLGYIPRRPSPWQTDPRPIPDTWNFDTFRPILSSKFKQIRHLIIGCMPIHSLELARWFITFSNIISLSPIGETFEVMAYQALISAKMECGGILCPNLQILSPYSTKSCSYIKDLLLYRENVGRPLRTLIWDINAFGEVQRFPCLGHSPAVKMRYQGEVRDPRDDWVGPDVVEDSDSQSFDEHSDDEVDQEDGAAAWIGGHIDVDLMYPADSDVEEDGGETETESEMEDD